MISSAKLIVAALLLSSATVYAHEITSSHLRGSSEIAWNPYKHVEKHVKKHAKKAIDGKHGRKYVEKKCDCGSTSSYTTSSSYDSEDNTEVEEDMEFEDKSWKQVKKYAGQRHGCICLVEVDENGEEYIVDEAMMV